MNTEPWNSDDVAGLVKEFAQPLTGSSIDHDPLMELIGDARIVMLGESSHGTHEFYSERAAITKRLITEKGFSAVVVEADWPDAYRVNRYVRAAGDDADGAEALAGFERFPAWMWRNADVLDFIGWLRDHNDAAPAGPLKTGFYGLDLYSLHASAEAVIEYLRKVDPAAAHHARQRYACFEIFGTNMQAYAFAAGHGLTGSCEDEAVAQLMALRRNAALYLSNDGRIAEDELFFAEQNARLVKNAEEYYRMMFRGRIASWNLRDRHMAESLEALIAHLGRFGTEPRVVVWAHNSHIGNASATEMGARGERNVGQLMRMKYGNDVRLIGFTTYDGTVTAASDWDAPAERKVMRPAIEGSYESLFHESGVPRFYLHLHRDRELAMGLSFRRLERAIGVIYHPETELVSHYFDSRITGQFDAVIHIDHTRAVEPLDRDDVWGSGEIPEAFPTAL